MKDDDIPMTTMDREKPASQRYMFLVLGMHRSGTSALSGLLHHLGCRLPSHLIRASENNPRGYFESESVRQFNDRLLDDCGSLWNDWRPLPAGWFRSPEGQARLIEARDLLEAEFEGAALAVLKDPRICRMVPFWRDAIEAAGFRAMPILTFRNPLEVAHSLSRRNEMDTAETLLIWLRHSLDAEAATRGAPRQVTNYEQVLTNWAGLAESVQKTFELSLPRFDTDAAAEIEEFLSPELRHHVEDPGRITDNPTLLDWVRDTYKVLDRWSSRHERKTDHAVLDRVRDEFDAAAPAFGPLIGPTSRSARKRADLQGKVTELEKKVQDLDGTAERLRGELVAAEKASKEAARNAANEAASAEREQAAGRAGELESEIAGLRDQLEAAEASRTRAEEQAAGRAQELAKLREQLEAAEAARTEADEQAAATAKDRDSL
ncbi:sulfotransferase family protein, partial [Roseovarius sp.]|uniref:sulfotransferase family protein n=1 Tax=Roseovarius sp. TaxID=1486281 RepID=UPI00356146B5